MEDLYDDLNNYENVNCVQELRNENMELKVKLEEHAAAMEKLQKQILQEYDTLEMEFKKLENNYSSLLKTARSEIERKTQRISQINMEKDMMVLQSIKNGTHIRRHYNKGLQNTNKINNQTPNKGYDNKKVKEDDVKLKKVPAMIDKCEPATVQTKNMVPYSGTDYKSNFPNKPEFAGAKPESFNNRKSNFKENITHHRTEYNDTPKTLASSIKNRRKSLPAVRMPIDKFSTDEECEQNYNTKDTRTDLPLMDKIERRNINKFPTDRHGNRTSETSNIEDRGSNYHESIPRDNYRGRTSRQHDNSSYRGRDKYEVSLKSKKHYSPDRGQNWRLREYRDDYYRQEQGRYRPLESPPPESFNRNQSRRPRSNYDRHSHDYERYRHRHEEKYVAKHKMANDYDEPHAKRHKTDSFGYPDAHFKEDRRYYNDRKSMDVQSTPAFSLNQYDILHFSCQSPDYVHNDAALADPIKEILTTAELPLEDPRVTSESYVLKKENGIETLSTAMGRHIDIKSVDKVVWKNESVKMPDALVRRPSLQCSDELVKDIYMDLNNPVANMSMESGEVRFESTDESQEISNKIKEIQYDIQDTHTSKQVTEEFSKQATNADKIFKPNVTKYRIPKICQNNKKPASKMDVPIIEVGENVPHNKNDIKTVTTEDIFLKKSLTVQQNEEHVNFLPRKTNDSKHKHKKESENQISLSKIAIVADDLELSDDNSDNVDYHSQTVTEKVREHCQVQSNQEIIKGDSTSVVEDHLRDVANDNDTEKAVDAVEVKTLEDEKNKESDSTKKQKSKKKKSKSKEVSKDLLETTDAIPVAGKKTRSKKEKESKTTESKNRFSDLFGDSSSLMTPEDLGLPSYLPISEDAQDAVDMKINQIIDAPILIDNVQFPVDNKDQSTLDIKQQEATTNVKLSENVLQISNSENKEQKDIKKKKFSKRKEEFSVDNTAQSTSDIKRQEATTNVKIPEKVLHNISNSEDKELKDIKKIKSSKRKEEIVDVNEISPRVVYENLNPGTELNEPDVVKTVIISTGVQPEVTIESNIEAIVTGKPIADVEEVNTKRNITDNYSIPTINILKALATSTPQKEFTALNSIEAEARTTDFICDTNISKTIVSNGVKVSKQTETNKLDSHDAPDVRIFVKRRRKLVKRPPMN